VAISDGSERELVDMVGSRFSQNTRLSPVDPTCNLPPTPKSSPMLTSPSAYRFGCRWDSVDYSCAYDCVFMTFVWMYLHAPQTWRETWVGGCAATTILSGYCDAISRSLDRQVDNSAIPVLFSSGRNAFRDTLSKGDPERFKRRGGVLISVGDVLDSLSRGQTTSMFFLYRTSCDSQYCYPVLTTPAGAPYMLTPNTWNSITQSKAKPSCESLQRWITGFCEFKVSSLPQSPSGCDRKHSHTLTFLQPPWIWFDIFLNHPRVVLPSFEISLGPAVYRLASVIYGNSKHFVARLSTPSGMWWSYDGMINGGQPVEEMISDEKDLLEHPGKYAMSALVYCIVAPPT